MTSTTSGRAVSVGLALAIVLAACSGSDGDATPTSPAPATSEPQPATTADPAPDTTPATTSAPTTTVAPAPRPVGETAFGRAQELLSDADATDVDRALIEFALRFGAVPGAPDLAPDGSEPATATGALDAIDAVFDDLTAEQQSAVTDRVRPVFDAAFTPVRGFARSASTPQQAEFQALADQMADRLTAEIGGVAPEFEIIFAGDDPAAGDLVTDFGFGTMSRQTVVDWLERLIGDYAVPTSDCGIVVGPRGLALEGAERVSAVAHEMFHCWSIMNSADTAAHDRTPSWYQEGVAAWVGEEISGGSAYSTYWWAHYMDGPAFALVHGMKYPAIGFWSWVDSHGADLWSLIPALQAAATTGDPLSVYAIATAGMDADEASTWASARVRRPDHGPAWDMDGPGIGDRAHSASPIELVVGDDRTFETSALGVRNITLAPLEALDAGPDHLVGVALEASGSWRLRWGSGDELTTVTGPASMAWCTTSPCVCPDGTTPAGYGDAPPGTGELAVALTGTGDRIGTLGVSVTELCDEVEPEPDPGDPSPAGLAGIWNATGDAIDRFARNAYADAEGAEVVGADGAAVLTFDGAGNGTLEYVALRIFVEVAGVPLEVGVDGGGSFGYTLDGTTMSITGTDMSLAFDVLGETLVLTGDDVPLGGESDYTWGLDGDSLLLQQQSSNAPVPNEWRRVG